jgi:hypothetical protein
VVKAMPLPLNPWERRSGTHRTGGWVVLGASLDGSGIFRLHRHSKHGLASSSESLYRLRFPSRFFVWFVLYLFLQRES